MGTTSNYSWPTPEATDLVKDGWEAIKDLGDAADASLKTVADASGLVHINTTSFSAVSSFSVNNVFSATYQNYKMIVNLKGTTTGADLSLRVRVSGTDLTSGTYNWQRGTFESTSTTAARGSSATSAQIGQARANVSIPEDRPIALDMMISNVFETEVTTITSTYSDYASSAAGSPLVQSFYSNVNNLLSYDGFTILVASGTITGNVIVYGYRK